MSITTRRSRVNHATPSTEIVQALACVSAEVKDIAALIAEYATQFEGQVASEMNSASACLRAIRHKLVAVSMTVEDAEELR